MWNACLGCQMSFTHVPASLLTVVVRRISLNDDPCLVAFLLAEIVELMPSI